MSEEKIRAEYDAARKDNTTMLAYFNLNFFGPSSIEGTNCHHVFTSPTPLCLAARS